MYCDGIDIDYSGLPERHRETVRRYIEAGCDPGSGWTAILNNDLAAVVKVDDDTFVQLRAIWRWLYNHAPQACWGSGARVAEWTRARREERNAA